MTNSNYAVAYCRVSTDKLSQQTSYDTQLELFQPIAQQNGETFLEVYADQGETGTLLDNRDNFERMLHDAGLDILRNKYKGRVITNFVASNREPKFHKIYIKNTSRFARNTLSKQIVAELKKKGVAIQFFEQNLNTLSCSTMQLDMYQMFDEWESRDKSLKVTTALQNSADKNIIRNNKRIFGYKYHPIIKDDRNAPDSNRLEAIPEEAEIVKLIFELYASGKGIRAIGKILAKQEIKTRDGGTWGKSSIGRILDNEKYTGRNPILKWTAGTLFEKVPLHKKDDYNIMDNDKIDPIISVELFEKCKKIRQGNTENKRGRNPNASMFQKRIKCGNCGTNYNVDTYDGKRVYRCPTRKFKGKDACSNHYVEESACINFVQSEEVAQTVLKHIYERINVINRRIADNQQLLSLRDDPDAYRSFERVQRMALEQEKNEVERNFAAVFTQVRTKQITQEQYNILANQFTQRIKEISEEIRNISSQNFNALVDIENEQFERDGLKRAANKIQKNKEYLSQHIHIFVNDGNLSINMDDTVLSLIHDVFD